MPRYECRLACRLRLAIYKYGDRQWRGQGFFAIYEALSGRLPASSKGMSSGRKGALGPERAHVEGAALSSGGDRPGQRFLPRREESPLRWDLRRWM